MGLKGKLFQKFLDKSGSYNYYKNKYEAMVKTVDRLEKSVESNNRLFNTLYLDHRLTPTELTQNFKDFSVEFLKFIDNVCMKHDLEWMIDYGTFLGAIRHGGFLPWDDDLDAGMMRKDYNKLIDILPDELERNALTKDVRITFKKKFEFVEGATTFVQIIYKQDEPKWIDLTALDIFPYDYMKDYNGEDLSVVYQNARNQFYHDVADTGDMNFVLERYFNSLNLTYDETPYLLNGVEGPLGSDKYKLMVLDKDEIMPFKRVRFEGTMLPGPKNSDYYLKNVYGNYWEIPMNLTFHPRMKRLRKYPNINEVYERNIAKLKEINDNFD